MYTTSCQTYLKNIFNIKKYKKVYIINEKKKIEWSNVLFNSYSLQSKSFLIKSILIYLTAAASTFRYVFQHIKTRSSYFHSDLVVFILSLFIYQLKLMAKFCYRLVLLADIDFYIDNLQRNIIKWILPPS
jgi:hypothetical protein